MEAKDGSTGFDFGGTYTKIEPYKVISYVMDDGRKVDVTFTPKEDGIYIEEDFEAEDQYPQDFQREGWQAILNNFKTYTESSS